MRANPALRAMLDLQKAEYKIRYWNDAFEAGAWGALQALASKGSDGEPGDERHGRAPLLAEGDPLERLDRRFVAATAFVF